jgi:uncharacterized protein involved in exopolysaccharide biosynthesis
MNEMIQLTKRLWNERKLILKWCASGFFLGLLLFIGTPKEYTSKVTLLAVNQNTSMLSGLLQQFGGMAGMGLGITEPKEALTPALYPEIVRSTPFLISVMKQKVKFKDKDSLLTVFTYLSEYQSMSIAKLLRICTIGLPSTIKKWIKRTPEPDYWSETIRPVRLSTEQERVKKELAGCINANYTTKTEMLTISIQMRDPEVVAQLTDTIAGMLANYVIGYRTQKAQADFNFIHNSYLDSRQRFLTAQQNLASFRDQNRNIISAVTATKEEQLKDEFNVAFNVYNSLAQQLEQARIKVQEATPVFKVIEPARIPLRASPVRYLLVFFSVLMGFFVALGLMFIKYLSSPIIQTESEEPEPSTGA